MSSKIKEAALEAIKDLPDTCDWEDIQYLMYVRQKIQLGLDDIEAGRIVPEEEVFREYE
jgi:predicted transcriptional regulator